MSDAREPNSIELGGMTFTAEEFAMLSDAPFWMLAEAIASVRLSRDPAAQTYALDDVLREAGIDPAELEEASDDE